MLTGGLPEEWEDGMGTRHCAIARDQLRARALKLLCWPYRGHRASVFLCLDFRMRYGVVFSVRNAWSNRQMTAHRNVPGWWIQQYRITTGPPSEIPTDHSPSGALVSWNLRYAVSA